MKCHFFIQIMAPEGLGKIEPYLQGCHLKLATYKSGFNDKIILRSLHGDDVEWSMDSSESDIIVAFGYIAGEIECAKFLLGDLSDALKAANYPHETVVDNERGELTQTLSYMWDHQTDL